MSVLAPTVRRVTGDIVQAALPVIAALVAVHLTNRHQERLERARAERDKQRAKDERKERRQEERKALYAELLQQAVAEELGSGENYVANEQARRVTLSRIELLADDHLFRLAAAVNAYDRKTVEEFAAAARADLDR